MTDKRPRRPDDDEPRTVAGPGARSDAGGTHGDFGVGDLESLPGRRPLPKPPAPPPAPEVAPRRKLPEPGDSFDVPAETSPADFDAIVAPTQRATPSPEATLPDSTAVMTDRSAEAPTREIDIERELPTIVGEFADSKAPRRSSAADPKTLAGAGAASDRPTGGDLPNSVRSEKPGRPFGSPLSNAAARTARDPIVGSAVSRASQPGDAGAGQHALAEGQLLADRYELIERLGKGGMGEVWKAKHILLQGHRAIKVIKASISRDAAFRQRFLHEGQTMMRVKHPGVVEVTDLDETRSNRELFMVMEYLKGRTIYDAIRDKQRPLASDARDAVRILREVALGMQRIHDERIVHKDLKSDNVLLVMGDDGKEHPKVIDFGLAKRLGDKDADVEHPQATSPAPTYDPDLRTTLAGTLAYMAPEQFRHEPSSFQSDIYAFGVMAYEAFAGGDFPLPRGSVVEYMKLHEAGKVPEPLASKRKDLDPRLCAIFDECLAVKREARPESFTRVADDLQHWLDTPEREARKRKLVYTYATAAALVGVTVWAVFIKESGASLSTLTFSGGGKPYLPAGDRTLHLPDAALPTFEISAAIDGTAGDPVLEIEGRRHVVTRGAEGGRFVVRADLSDLADGEYSVALRPSSGGLASEFRIAVDGERPKVRGVSVQGAVVAKDGMAYSRSDSPVVVVDLAEPTSGVREVFALSRDGAKSPGEREPSSDKWDIKGTATGDGKVECDVVVHDLAGNETRQPMAYVKDVKKPTVVVRDRFTRTRHDNGEKVTAAWVRSADGAKLGFSVDEAVEATATFAGGAPVVRRLDAAGAIDFDLPQVPGAGLATTLVVRDVAGNESVSEFPVVFAPDEIHVVSQGLPELVVRAGVSDPSVESSVTVVASYPLATNLSFSAKPLFAADGKPVDAGIPRPAKLEFKRNEADDLTGDYVMGAKALADGGYELSVVAPGESACSPLSVTVDSTDPAIESVTVEDAATGAPITDWALAPDVVVRVVAMDTSLQRIDLGGAKPVQSVQRGRQTYTFRKHLDHEGDTAWTLALADAAGHTAEQSVPVHGDWTAPTIERLDAPANGASLDDITAVEFVGRCSEDRYTLVVEGLPNDATRQVDRRAKDFKQGFLLPDTKGPVALRVVAVDEAGHRSEPKIVTVNVVHRGAVHKDEITWTQGVTTPMERVVQGDVFLSACAQPVIESYIDKTEVTNAQYGAFLAAVKKDGDAAWRHPEQPKNWSHVPSTWDDAKGNAPDWPVVNVAYWDAYAFAKWSGRRLPTEAEWVKAAAKMEGERNLRQWPSFCEGQEWKNGVLATSETVEGPVCALKSDDVSPIGCLHMGGNVSEWVDLASPSGEASRPGTRGGNWFFTKVRADVRKTPGTPWDRDTRYPTIGFRCAVNADKAPQ